MHLGLFESRVISFAVVCFIWKERVLLSKLTRMDTSVSDESNCVANSMALGLDGFDNVISCAPVIKRIHTYINGLWTLKFPGGYRDT